MITETIKNSIREALLKIGISHSEIHLEHPDEISHGDYSTNIALALAKEVKENPKALAEKIKKELDSSPIKEIEKVEVAGAGFINFYLTKDFFADSLKDILLKGDEFGKGELLKGKIALFEYTDPNAFKDFHIGHLMSNAIGESLSRLAEAEGATVKRLCYGSDIGLPVAKAVWGMQKFTLANKSAFPHDGDSLSDKVRFLSDSYVAGNTAYEEDEIAKKEIKEINKKLYEMSDQELNIYYKKGREWSLQKLNEIYLKLGTKFDQFYFESEMAEQGKNIVLKNIENGIFEKSEGAIVFKGEKYGLHTRVFLTSEGLPPYEAKELALFDKKQKDFSDNDVSVVVTANEQNDYFKVVSKVISILSPEIGEKLIHVSHGLLRFAEGKMSSRKGNVITGESLLLETEKDVYEKIADRDLSAEEKKEVAEAVSVAAIKYSILKQYPGKDIIYDKEKSLAFEGDTGPYLEYSYVRASSLLEKVNNLGIEQSIKIPSNWETKEIEKLLYRYPEVLRHAWDEKGPQIVAEYIMRLSSSFNAFYTEGKIADKEDVNSSYKIAITRAFSIVLKSGLYILGIKALRKM